MKGRGRTQRPSVRDYLKEEGFHHQRGPWVSSMLVNREAAEWSVAALDRDLSSVDPIG